MNELTKILTDLSNEERRTRGLLFTPSEIHQQPAMWERTLSLIDDQAAELSAFLEKAGVLPGGTVTLYFLGAGTSEYVGNAVADTLRRRLRVNAVSLPTTSFITAPADWIQGGRTYLFVHFARSGDSPESIASYEQALRLAPDSFHLVITCNRNGRLATEPRQDERVYILTLPDETNDQSLVMTSSFSSMAVAALSLSHLASLERFRSEVGAASGAARRVLEEQADTIQAFASQGLERLQFLGTGNLYGCMQESRLKVLEMTGGRILANANTYLGLRHGPQVFVNEECGVIASISSDAYRRGYEIDLLEELRTKHQGREVLVICDRRDHIGKHSGRFVVELAKEGEPISNDLRVVTDVVVGQLLGLFACIRLGLKPDNPSESGIINRVVSGVRIYPHAPTGSGDQR